jgi:hypothetical protein
MIPSFRRVPPPPPPYPPQAWSYHHAKQDLKRVHNAVQFLLQSEVFSCILNIFRAAPFEAIKFYSYKGAACVRHAAVDLGNWPYCIFYTLLLEFAPEDHVIQCYAKTWPSTAGIGGHHSAKGIEKAGDVVEMVLGYYRTPECRLNPRIAAIPPDLQLLFHKTLETGLKALNRLVARFEPSKNPPCAMRDRLINAFEWNDFA